MRTTTMKKIAVENGYSEEAITAGIEACLRKHRLSNPPGEFDSAGRFFASERTRSVENVRAPSRAFPYPEMKAARSAKHVAEVFDVEPLHIKRIIRAIETENKLNDELSGHEKVALGMQIKRILKPVR